MLIYTMYGQGVGCHVRTQLDEKYQQGSIK
jgi:hypothetical protein